MGKTFKDIRKFDIKRNKEGSRNAFGDSDMRTRVKPNVKKEKGGGKNWRDEFDAYLEDEFEEF